MADNVAFTPGAGATFATDDIGGIHHQMVKLEYGALDSATPVSPANPLPSTVYGSGVATGSRADGFLNVRPDPTSLLFDTFETLDTTNTWTTSGTTPPTGAAGSATANPGVTASGTSLATSKATFTPGSNAFLQFACFTQIEAAVITGAVRFWGLGILNGTPTTTAPITNGSIFEVGASDGLLYGRVYSGGAVTQTVALTRPTDAAVHRYQITYKASRVYFNIDNVEVGTLPFPNPAIAALATVFGTVNGGVALTTATSTSLSLVGLADTGKNSAQLSDGTFPWRKAKVDAAGNQLVISGSTTGAAAPAAAHYGGMSGSSGNLFGLRATGGVGDGSAIDGHLVVAPYIFNGSSFDRQRGTGGAANVSLPATTLLQTATAAAGTGVTVTLPAVAGQFHYITAIEIAKYASVAVVGAAAPVLVTTTNLPGALAYTTPTAQAVGTQYDIDSKLVTPLKSSTVNTATTIVAPATTSVIWRVTVAYYTAA